MEQLDDIHEHLTASDRQEGLKARIVHRAMRRSIMAATREQGMTGLIADLERIVPDITAQYSRNAVIGPLVTTKLRAVHAFQIGLVLEAMRRLEIRKDQPPTIVDIGDSAGTHLQYLNSLIGNCRSLSVNTDSGAVAKIQAKGLEAIHARAEDVHTFDVATDIFMSFETVEHLSAPLPFLASLAKTDCKALVLTVPYVAHSRVALRYIRTGDVTPQYAEHTHIFELSPDDWNPLFRFAGWRVLCERIYRQYPMRSPARAMKSLWRRLDFEGFYGVILVPDDRWRALYRDE